jgi:hypothetical protein
MATVNVGLSVQSPDITSDILSFSVSSRLTKDGSVGIDEIVGVSRLLGIVDARTVILSDTLYPNGGLVYVRNLSVYADTLTIAVGSTDVGVIHGGEFCVFPWDASDVFAVTGVAGGTDMEYLLFVR